VSADARHRGLALWGGRDIYRGQPINALIALTATELFADHGIFESWKEDGQAAPAYYDATGLYEVSNRTLRRYLALSGFWEERFEDINLRHLRASPIELIRRRSSSRPMA
jgi:hypothetical protein